MWFMAGFLSSGFACCRAGFMAGFMSSKKPCLNRAKMQAGFACYLPRRLAFLAQVEDVLFEDGWMGFHAAFCWRSRIAAAFSKARLAAASYCSAVGHPAT